MIASMPRRLHLLLLLPLPLLLAACAQRPVPPQPRNVEAPPQAMACPADVPASTRCLGGVDSAGAHYLIAMPADWNGVLVMHAHGGPFLGAATAKRVEEDLKRWSIMPRAGYAWAGSSYRQGGVAVKAAAEDTERLRQLFVAQVARPQLTLLQGQSWGASVAAKGAEMFQAGQPYDGVLLTSGVLAGGTKAYEFRLDLRVVYQYLCHNHPRADEAQYPLWMGLPAGASMSAAELRGRANECLGLDKPAAQRSPEQARRLKTIVDVIQIPERSVLGHLSWATGHFQDIAQHRSGGGNVFGNLGAQYRGSDDDAALNAGVARYAADAAALARFGADADLGGDIPVPVLTVHAIDDPTAFVEMQDSFARTMAAAGRSANLVQTYSQDREHSYVSDASYVAALQGLRAWVERGEKPTARTIAAGCERALAQFPSSCRFRPDYQPAALATRVTPRR